MEDFDIVCNCMGITKGEIVAAIKEKDLHTVEEVGDETEAGTVCGSCIEDIEDILAELGR